MEPQVSLGPGHVAEVWGRGGHDVVLSVWNVEPHNPPHYLHWFYGKYGRYWPVAPTPAFMPLPSVCLPHFPYLLKTNMDALENV